MSSPYGPEAMQSTQEHLMKLAAMRSDDQATAQTLVDMAHSDPATIFYIQNERALLDHKHPLNDDGNLNRRIEAADLGDPVKFALFVSELLRNMVDHDASASS